MPIQIAFDDDVLLQYWRRSSPPFFTIYWEQGGIQYPDSIWTDFGSVILGWWMGAIYKLLDGATDEKFQFMDGPYSIRISRVAGSDQVVLQPEDLNVSWTSTLPEIGHDIVSTMRRVAAHFTELGIEPNWCGQIDRIDRDLELRLQDRHRPEGQ